MDAAGEGGNTVFTYLLCDLDRKPERSQYKDTGGWKSSNELRTVLCAVSCHMLNFQVFFFLVPDTVSFIKIDNQSFLV